MTFRLLSGLSAAILGISHSFSIDTTDPFWRSKHRMRPIDVQMPGLLIFSGNSNPSLASEIADHLGTPLARARVTRFADGEHCIQFFEHIRGRDAFIVQSTGPPVNENLMELLLMVSALRRASAKKITAVIPYYGYSRRDKQEGKVSPISAADTAKMIESMGADRVISCDLHSGQIQGFFKVPVDNLNPSIIGHQWFESLKLNNLVIVSPDSAGVPRAKLFKNNCKENSRLAILIRERLEDNSVITMDLVGDVDGCDVIIVDDIVDTGNTLTKASQLLKEKGANRVFAFITHGLFTGDAIQKIEDSPLEKVICTNSLSLVSYSSKIDQVSIGIFLAEAIRRAYQRESFSDLSQNSS